MNYSMNITVPRNVQYILDVLQKHGYQAFIVGGCVRDFILGRKPDDWDIVTDAVPEAVKGLFPKTFDTGTRHGTITVLIGNHGYEVTTFRIDGEYTDFRKPQSVTFASSIDEDLSRRDFTINTVAYNAEKGMVDLFGGIRDIKNGIIRTVGDPDRRFNEDALRMLRAVRFSAQLNFTVDEKTLRSIEKNSKLIENISAERIRAELTKILLSDNPFCFSLLMDTGLIRFVLPEFEPCFSTEQKNPCHIYNVAFHTLHSVANIKKDKVLRWTMLFHDIGKPGVKTTDEKGIDHFYNHQQLSVKLSRAAMLRLRFDRKSMDRILLLVKYHNMNIRPDPKSVRRAISKTGEDVFEDLLTVIEADKKSQNPKLIKEWARIFKEIRKIYKDIREKGQCTDLKSLAVGGDDLIALGIKPGKEIKELLQILLEKVIEEPGLNKKEVLLDLLRKHYGSE